MKQVYRKMHVFESKTLNFFIILFCLLNINFVFHTNKYAINSAFASKEDYSTTFEEFLPLGAGGNGKSEEELYKKFAQDETIVKNARVEGIRFLKEKKQILFSLSSDNLEQMKQKNLKYEIVLINFPPRVVVRMYGVNRGDQLLKFFSGIDIIGVVLNPFSPEYVSEYVLFFKDWIKVHADYSPEDTLLSLSYQFTDPEFTKGYGVRIADTNLDPLSQVVEVKNELVKSGLQAYFLLASDQKTVVLESPFYGSKSDAVSYMESLESFGYNGKLAIRSYRDFPKPHRYDVTSEAIVTRGDSVNLKNIAYNELLPHKIYSLPYRQIYTITKPIFSQKIQEDPEEMATQYYNLAGIFAKYTTDDPKIKREAMIVAMKIYEIIYFKYPQTAYGDDALWEIAQLAKNERIEDMLSERECYERIIKEYSESSYKDEAMLRLTAMREQRIHLLYRKKGLENF